MEGGCLLAPGHLLVKSPAQAGSLTDYWSVFSPLLCPHWGQVLAVWYHICVPAQLC